MSITFVPKNIQPDSILQEVTSFKFRRGDIDKKISSFTWGIFDIIYYLGRLQTKPLHILAQRFQHLRYKDSSISLLTKIRMTFLVIICIPTAVLTIPGAAMMAFAKRFSKNFSYSPAEQSALNSSARQVNALKIMTWNTGLGPGFMSIDNRLKPPQERIDDILATIESQNPNVLALQEVFDADAQSKIVEQLNAKGYDCIHSVLSSDALTLSSGLLLAVKRNSDIRICLEEINVWQFKNLVGPDAFSNKGLLGVRVKLSTAEGKEQRLCLFNTHLQASYPDAGYGKVRQQQVAAIAAKINAWSFRNEQFQDDVVCGDMNFGYEPLELSDANQESESNEYDTQMQEFAKARLWDPNQAAQYEKKGSFYELKQGNPHRVKSVVDYILVSQSLKTQTSSSKIVELDVSNTNHLISDHYPVIHSITNLFAKPTSLESVEAQP